MNQRTMTGPRRCDTKWPQTEVMPRRAMRTRENPYRRPQREPINWGLCLMLAGAITMTLAALVYKFAGPST
jgi:hypothetical protein